MPVNRNKKSPRFGLRYRVGAGGSHVYRIKGRKVVIGGKKPAPRKPKPDPYAREIEAASALRYGDQERQVAAERRISEQAMRNSNSWWSD